MIKRSFLLTLALCAAATPGGKTLAHASTAANLQGPDASLQMPVNNISRRHGKLRAAQGDIIQAYQKIDAAQKDNQDQLGGHAQRAKELLIQADNELRAAAGVSNAEGR